MAGASVEVKGLRELRRDLKRIDRDLPREINQELKRAGEPVLREAKRLAPRSTVPGPHVADSLKIGTRGSRLIIYSRHPGVKTIHFGGRHPLFGNRGYWYDQKPTLFIPRAAERHQRETLRRISDTIEREMRRAGFRSL